MLVNGCPGPRVVCGVGEVVFGAACVELITFLSELGAVAIVARVGAAAVSTFYGAWGDPATVSFMRARASTTC